MVAPFVSTVPPGLHVFYTPQKDRPAYVDNSSAPLYSLHLAPLIWNSDLLCSLLVKAFGSEIDCTLPEHAFTSQPILSERFASFAAYQYYENIPSLHDLIVYLQETVCGNDQSCRHKANALESADYVDFDYDTISQSVILNAFWHAGPKFGTWDEHIDNRKASVKVEAGVLANETPTNDEELSLGGFLVVLGEDEKPSQ